ncbi:hypothetical protein GCM10027589_06960 [Actinocorallia lasiicapitis]
MREHGWSVVGVREEPAWAFTVGLWHSFGVPELAMFGLPVTDLQFVLDEVAGARDGALPVERRTVDEDWRGLFGWLDGFYGRAVPVTQVRWPGGDELQPELWVPRAEHPPNMWLHLAELTPWPFADALPAEPVATLHRVLGGNEICGIVHTADGHWQFLDGGPIADAEVTLVPLARILGEQPAVIPFADLDRGHQAWLQADGSWDRTPI